MLVTPFYILFGLVSAAFAVPVPPDGVNFDRGTSPGGEVILLGKIDGPITPDANVEKQTHQLPPHALNHKMEPKVTFGMNVPVQALSSAGADAPNVKINNLFKAAASTLGLPPDVRVTCLNNQHIDPSAMKIELTITSKMGSGPKLAIEAKMPLKAVATGGTGSWIKDKDGNTLFSI
ncbi:hypothetical protein D9757_010433 [Collybiopsis confluens]|uniref:Uncharacterized protein n=1 Tax=Collybiopsis confluens TaxID=2823264 RepID=A0A8H5LTH2_9AGAR|nr:hypothetical protein D9757_010433 [Collybiopsis confluens]